jgi:type 1 fimbria pilin
MAVAISGTHWATSTGEVLTATVSVTRAAGEGLIACVFRENTGGATVDTVSSVVWDAAGDNQALTFIRTQQESSSASRYIGLYYLPAPTSAKTADVTVTFSGTTFHDNDGILVRRITGHDTSSMIRGSNGFNQVTFDSSTPVSDSLASAAGDLVIDFFSTRLGVGEASATSGQADSSENTAQFSRSVCSSSKAGDTSVSMGWESTNGTSFSQAHVILSVQSSSQSGVGGLNGGKLAGRSILLGRLT